jgi:transcriptional regulator with XRE-family HTH domain
VAPTTYSEVLAGNIRSARTRIKIEQESVAARMRALGFSAWARQTVSRVERGTRRVTAEEVFGLAYALETSIGRLMAPTDEDKVVEFPSGDPIAVEAVRMSASGNVVHGLVVWTGDEPQFVDYHPAVLDVISRKSAGEWPPEG